jgi:hypothetical protein
MMRKHKYKLIKGNFPSVEAGKVLFALINSKINYHSMIAFSDSERYNKDLSRSRQRIDQLKKVSEKVKKQLDKAAAAGKKVKVSGIIEIEVFS